MDALFRHHKPRIKDFCFLKTETIGHTIKTFIRLLSSLSRNPSDSIRYITRFFRRNCYILCYIIFIGCIRKSNPILQDIEFTENIMLNMLLSPGILQLGTSLLPLPLHSEDRKVVGIIPDGNRRWAGEHSHSHLTPSSQTLTKAHGHFFGAYRIVNLIRWCILDKRVSHLVVYVLTYDNYTKRSEEEQSAIREILRGWIDEFNLLNKAQLADIAVLGEPDDVFRESLGEIPINPNTRRDDITKVSLLLCYDGRREIRQAKGDPENLWLKEDIDIVIRTGYTQRSSGFCTYQTSYSEWFYPGIYWPEFTVSTFNNIMNDASRVQQNYGK